MSHADVPLNPEPLTNPLPASRDLGTGEIERTGAELSLKAWLDLLQRIGDTPEHRDLMLQNILDAEHPNLYDEDTVAFLAHIYDDHRL